MAESQDPIRYGDLRMTTEREGGKTCLFWVRRIALTTSPAKMRCRLPSSCFAVSVAGCARRVARIQRAAVLHTVCGAAQGRSLRTGGPASQG